MTQEIKKKLFSDIMNDQFRLKPQFTEKTVREHKIVESEITIPELMITMRTLMQKVEQIANLSGKEKKEIVLTVLTAIVNHFKAGDVVGAFIYGIASDVIDELVLCWNSDRYLLGPSGCKKFEAKLKRRLCCK